MNEGFKALILNHKHAGIQVREEIALSGEQCKQLLFELKELSPASDLLVLSTCNRTEFYYTHSEDLSPLIITLLQTHKALDADTEALGAFIPVVDSASAVRHLFRVSFGLDSQIPGDMQIIAQVKEAYQWSADAQTAGPFLHRLLHTIFFANKRVVQETGFRTGAASIAYAAQALAEEMLLKGADSRIVVLGVGEMGANLCRNLTSEGYKNVIVLNRTVEKAQALAQECGIAYGSLDTLADEIAHADAVISCLAVQQPAVNQTHLENLGQGRRVLMFDLSVPRSISPLIEGNPSVLLYNIDELEQRASLALQARLAEVPKVEAILEEALTEFNDWSREMLVSPAINRFKEALETIRQEELARYVKGLSPAEMELMEKITGSLVQRIVKLPVLELKAACRRGDAEEVIESLASLFNLDMVSDRKK
jgi:glutamyl-tRNA reductase